MTGASTTETGFKGSCTKMGTPVRGPELLKEEKQVAKRWKGPDKLKRGEKAAGHNGKATDYLGSSPCLLEELKLYQADGATLDSH